MNHKIVTYQRVGCYLILFFLIWGLLPIVSAADTPDGAANIGGILAKPIYDEVLPINDGKIINTAEGWDYLSIWRQVVITDLSAYFEGTIFHRPFLYAAPILFLLLGTFCALGCASKKRKLSPLPENILIYIKDHPGCTQRQLIEAMNCSRGSVCYQLDELELGEELQKVDTYGIPLYYPVTAKDINKDPLEQAIRQLLSRKKSGRFLQVLYEHPNATRKELAESLNVLPKTIHWYVNTYADKNILRVDKDGTEYRYSLTKEAAQIYEFLTANPGANS